MKKRYWLLLLLLVACAPLPPPEPIVEVPIIREPAPQPIIEVPLPEEPERDLTLYDNVDDYVINKEIPPFSLLSTDAVRDRFHILPVERYDARYKSESVTTLVHIFKFSSRVELDLVLKSDFYQIIDRGADHHQGHNIALYLNLDDHRVVIWSSGTALIYVETFADFAAREIVQAYLVKYPSDLETSRCVDSDADDHLIKGTTTRVQIGSSFMSWTDVCMRDFAPYRNKQYVSIKGVTEEDGLLEGRCSRDLRQPGFISEYPCPRGCEDGKCTFS